MVLMRVISSIYSILIKLSNAIQRWRFRPQYPVDKSDWFDRAVQIVLEHEGKLNINDKDRGGATKYGISLRYLQLVDLDLNKDGKVDVEDIFCVSQAIATNIYRKDWWDRYKYHEINDFAIAAKVFDLAVNMGATQAHKLLQVVINRLSPHSLNIDGVLGSKTLYALNQMIDDSKAIDILEGFKTAATSFYKELVINDSELEIFEKGWLRRVNS